MKTTLILTVVILVVMSTTAFGQSRETLIKGKVDRGLYIGLSTKLTSFDGEFEPMLGFRAGLVLGHTFMIGAAGYSVLEKNKTDYFISDHPVEILPAYGGLQLLYIVNPYKLISYEFGTLIGFGGVNYTDHAYNSGLPNSDHIFVMEPEVALVLNVTNAVRVSSGLSYRWISGIDHPEVVKDSQLSGPALSIMLTFGSF